jgi:peptidoglycan LD-endopeptidase CwlK
LKLKKWIGSTLYIFLLVVIIFLFYLFSEKKIDDPVPPPAGLHPFVEEQTNHLIKQAADKGIVIVITDDFRSVEDQDLLYKKGRTTDGNIVTFAKGGESYHNFGLAIDFALKTPSGDVIWDMEYDGNKNGKDDWTEVVKMAKSLGFKWGGDWARFKDYPHLQMDFGLSIHDLQNGKWPDEDSYLVETN